MTLNGIGQAEYCSYLVIANLPILQIYKLKPVHPIGLTIPGKLDCPINNNKRTNIFLREILFIK
jgi:hypothetical protein